jgi:hypothetical protein
MAKYMQTTIPPGGAAGPDLGDGWTYRSELTKCTKPSCKTCGARTYAHGPYWYAFRHRQGKLEKVYVGRELRRVAEVQRARRAKAGPSSLLPKTGRAAPPRGPLSAATPDARRGVTIVARPAKARPTSAR